MTLPPEALTPSEEQDDDAAEQCQDEKDDQNQQTFLQVSPVGPAAPQTLRPPEAHLHAFWVHFINSGVDQVILVKGGSLVR